MPTHLIFRWNGPVFGQKPPKAIEGEIDNMKNILCIREMEIIIKSFTKKRGLAQGD